MKYASGRQNSITDGEIGGKSALMSVNVSNPALGKGEAESSILSSSTIVSMT